MVLMLAYRPLMVGDRAFSMAVGFSVRMAKMGPRRAFEVFVPAAMTAGSHGLKVANRAPCAIDHNLPQIAGRPGPGALMRQADFTRP